MFYKGIGWLITLFHHPSPNNSNAQSFLHRRGKSATGQGYLREVRKRSRNGSFLRAGGKITITYSREARSSNEKSDVILLYKDFKLIIDEIKLNKRSKKRENNTISNLVEHELSEKQYVINGGSVSIESDRGGYKLKKEK